MTRGRRFLLAATALALTVSLAWRPAAASADSFQISRATLRAPSGAFVGTVVALCTSTFNYVAVRVAVPASSTLTASIDSIAVATINIAPAETPFNGLLYVYGYPSVCPSPGSTLMLIDSATNKIVGEGLLTISPLGGA